MFSFLNLSSGCSHSKHRDADRPDVSLVSSRFNRARESHSTPSWGFSLVLKQPETLYLRFRAILKFTCENPVILPKRAATDER